MSSRRFTGKTESDAVMNAAMELGIPSTDLDYEVIDPGSNGFFGLFRKPAIIEIKEKVKEPVAEKQEKPAPAKPQKQTKKDSVKEVKKGYECGITLDNFSDIKVGDTLECYEMVEVKK